MKPASALDPVRGPMRDGKWPSFEQRWQGRELMDEADCDLGSLLRTIDQFESVNFWVSRYRSILRRWVLGDLARRAPSPAHVVDVGAGGCEIAVWLLEAASRRGLSCTVTALEPDARVAAHARGRYGHRAGLRIVEAGVESLHELGPIDYIFSNHVMHHVPDDELPDFLRTIDRHARVRWVMSDLYRSAWSYAAFQVFGRLYRNSFTFEDGKRSIRRGFRKAECRGIVERAGCSGRVAVHRLVPGRLVMVGEAAGAAS
jgi:2-polyprenyl-3-methyl-5-hydroxy-6-metoxy-1,4-benzoquinol methylase